MPTCGPYKKKRVITLSFYADTPKQRLCVRRMVMNKRTHCIQTHCTADLWKITQSVLLCAGARTTTVVFHPTHTHTRLSHTHFGFSCDMNAARGKSGSGPKLLPRQQMSVLTVAMDTGRVAGMEMEWHRELATHRHGASVLTFPSVFYNLQGQSLSVCVSVCLSLTLLGSQSP